MKPEIFVTRRLPETIMQKLHDHFSVRCNPYDRNLTYDELVDFSQNCNVMITMLADNIDRNLLLKKPLLKAVCNYAVGYNNIDVKAATEAGIIVCNTPGVLTETTADLGWALLMSAARRIVESDQFCRDGKFDGWEPLLMQGNDIYGKVLGIIGAGRIGQAFARRSIGFNMKIVYYDKNRCEYLENQLGAERKDLHDLLKICDFVSLHVPYNDSTHHLIGKNELDMMKSSAVLINTARGKVVEEEALMNALEYEHIAAAGLDVFYNEPEIPKRMKKLRNIVIVPHIGSASMETRQNMAQLVMDCAVAVIKDEKPPVIVNPEVLDN